MLSADGRRQLLRLARSALEAQVLGRTTVDLPDDVGAAGGAFVSIHCRGQLRGCLGRLEPRPLVTLVGELARAVADSDPRFAAVTAPELPDMEIEISVLGDEREIHSPAEIEVGRHGLILEYRGRRGLLLPQVATEHGWDRLTFLEHACLKAGVPQDAWSRGARLFVFDALVFSDRDISQALP